MSSNNYVGAGPPATDRTRADLLTGSRLLADTQKDKEKDITHPPPWRQQQGTISQQFHTSAQFQQTIFCLTSSKKISWLAYQSLVSL